MKNFKYQKQISELLSVGYELPPLFEPHGIAAYRFASKEDTANNHKPVCVQNPSRTLPGNIKTSGYALKRNFKNISKTLGNSLFEGKISDKDGLITEVDERSRHYDLYEYKECDLNKTLKFKTLL